MTPERWQQIEQFYHAALEQPPGQRAAFLAAACVGDDELRREVESLLASHEQAGTFIDKSPADVAAGMFAEEQAHSLLGRTLGHYQLQSLLGAGGMGEVYRARDLRLDRDVAVKILPEHLATQAEALWRFEREAKAVAALSHPHILAIFDFGTEAGVSYAVTELLEGDTLRARLQRGAIEWHEAVEVGAALAEGLAAAHAKGIIHRDLKPENIFLTADGGVKILDFGIARVQRVVTPDSTTVATGIETTRQGVVLGTIGYMSPEQVRGETAEAPSDIFSLGCVLYELLSGQRPFARATTAEMIAAILDAEPPPLAQKKIPAQLEQVIRHCLAKQPGARYQAARDLGFDLKTMLSGGAVTVPLPVRRRTRVMARRGAAAAIVPLVIAAWFFWGSGPERAIDSLAVLPLVNASGDENVEYLSDGITERLISSLSQLPKLKVMAQSAVFRYKGKEIDPQRVGQEMNVRAVLTGRLSQRAETLTIGIELVNVADGSRLWGEQYKPKLADVMMVQSEIAKQVSEKLRLALTGEQEQRLTKRYTASPEAHQLYLKGRYHIDKYTAEGVKQGLAYFKQAIDLDPNYALAHVGLADAYFHLSGTYSPPEEAMPRALALVQKALQLDETLPEAHAALAHIQMSYDWGRWEESERAFQRAIEMNPNYAAAHNEYGALLVVLGRFAEATSEMKRAQELDPLSPFFRVGVVWPLLFSRQYDEAIEQLQKIIAWNPDFVNAHLNLGWAYAHKGRYDEAIAALQQARSIDNKWDMSAALGYAYAKAGKRDEAEKVLRALQERAQREHISHCGFAIIYAGLGAKELALAALQKAYEARDDNLLLLKVDPFYDDLRSDPRFLDLLRRLKLAP
jgi:TolB-like protein/Tfp pilus assembly protein PilF